MGDKNQEKKEEDDSVKKEEKVNNDDKNTDKNLSEKKAAEEEVKEEEINLQEPEKEVKPAEEFLENIAIAEKEQLDAENRGIEKEKRLFKKETMITMTQYNWGNLDDYLHEYHRDLNPFFRYCIEIFVVGFLFFLLPSIFLIYTGQFDYESIVGIITNPGGTEVHKFFKRTAYIMIVYCIFILSKFILSNLILILIKTLDILEIPIEGHVGTFLQVLNNSLDNLRNAIAASLVFIVSYIMFGGYTLLKEVIDIDHLMMTLLLWYALFSIMLFIENLTINIFIGELGRKNFSGRIYDANYKAFVFKKLAAIAQATPLGESEVEKVIVEMKNFFESSIYLRHKDLKLNSESAANKISESIFGYLDIEKLQYEDIQKYFPDTFEDVYNFLSQNNKNKDPISFEQFNEKILDLWRERSDIHYSIVDRDNILNRLNFVLLGVVFFVGLITLMVLLNVNYKIYLASVGPFLFTFGWIFQGSVVEIYRCFVFILFSHTYDSGDMVVVNGVELQVIAIDLLYTTFKNANGMDVYIPNTKLYTSEIGNIRRSGLQYDEVVVNVSNNTKFENVIKLRDKMAESLEKMEREFTGSVLVRNFALNGDKLKIILAIQHDSNFQDVKNRIKRRESFIKQLELELSACGITYVNAFEFL